MKTTEAPPVHFEGGPLDGVDASRFAAVESRFRVDLRVEGVGWQGWYVQQTDLLWDWTEDT